ncbi:MAG: hypothetical protein K9J76_07265 [Polaromonas sp.]|nr:hypothetical protein [Polaromonas sp.]
MTIRSTSCPTLFLDFDGVLHPSHAKPANYFCNMPLLLDAIGNANVMIVVSSSWRFQSTYGEIECLFPRNIRGKLNGITGDAFIGRHARWHEIQSFVFARKISNWRALDDSRFEFPNHCPELIWCEGSRGLEQSQVSEIRTWLG